MNWKTTVRGYIEDGDPEKLLTAIHGGWPDIRPEDRHHIFQFLFNTSQLKSFIVLFLQELQEDQPVLPWDLLFAILNQKSLQLPSAFSKLFEEMFRSKKVEIPENPQPAEFLSAIKTKERYYFLAKTESRRKELLESARLAKSERLFDQQVEYLNELQKIFPGDVGIQDNIHQRQRNNAVQALAKSRAYKPLLSPQKQAEEKENEAFARDLAQQAQKFSGSDPQRQVDIAMMLNQMGFSKFGLDFLDSVADDDRAAWFLFEFLLNSKQHLSLLSHCETMKIRKSHDPEALFSISYFEALTLWELGERHRAVEIMRYISRVRPQFRSANELLSTWMEEVN